MHGADPSIQFWFPTPIYCKQLDLADKNNYLANKALTLKQKFEKSRTNWRCGTFNTLDSYNWIEDNDQFVIELIDICKNEVYKFSKSFGIESPIENLYCKDFWFNVAEPGDYQEYHQHADSHFSLSYYISTPEQSGNIVFKSFESMFDMHNLPIQESNLTALSYKTCSYTPKESMLVIFRSNLMHMVERNLSNQQRIGVSMNFSFAR